MSGIWQNDNGWNSRDRSGGGGQQRNMRPDSYGGGGGGGNSNSGGGRRDRYSTSPGRDMPNKRSRNNWNDEGRYNQGNNWDDSGYGNGHSNENGNSSQPMMTFKQFMSGLDDSIDHVEAAKRYNEYKLEFKRKQVNEFFAAHKDEEWFRVKYHPEESVRRKEVVNEYLRKRRQVFLDLLESGLVDSVSVDVEKAEAITKLLDSAVIKLEGGTEFDLKSLDENYFKAETLKEPGIALFTVDADADNSNDAKKESTIEKKNTDDKKEEKMETQHVDKDDKEEDGELEDSVDKTDHFKHESSKLSEEGQMDVEPIANGSGDVVSEEKSNEPKPRALHKTASIFLRYLPANVTRAELEEMFTRYPEYLRLAIAEPAMDKRFMRRGWVTFDRSVDIRKVYLSLNNVRIREIELGAIINRDLSRRIRSVNGIVSHRNNVLADIRHATKIILNLDEQRKIWEAAEPTAKEPSVIEGGDVNLEETEQSQERPHVGLEEPLSILGMTTRNPLLTDVSEYLIEEANAEEEELLGQDANEPETDAPSSDVPTLERDEKAIKVLDRLLIYLRIVHSVDYYNHIDYPNEDEMPNRIGIMHARGMSPTAKVSLREVNDYIKHFETKIAPFLQKPVDLDPEEMEKLGRRDPEKEVEKFILENTQELAPDKWLCPLSGKKFKGPDFVRKHIENKHGMCLDEVRKDALFFNNYLTDSKRPHLPENPMMMMQQSNRPSGNYSSGASQHSGGSGSWSNNSGYNNSGGGGGYNSSSVHSRVSYQQGGNGGNWNNPNGGSGLNRYGNRITTTGRYGSGGGGMGMMNRKRNYRDLDAPPDDM